MASDLMQLGISGLRTSQKQLDVTSHNISNVHTAGYSRQVVDQKAADAQWSGGNYYGSGAYIDSVNRAYDQFAARELTLSTTQLAEADTRQQHMTMLDDFTSKSAVNTVNSMNDFYNSVRSLSDHPNDLGARQTVLEQANQTAKSFNRSHEMLTNIRRDVNEQLDVTLDRVNALGQEIAAINTSLQEMPDGNKNHDLLDKQRGLINELAKYTKVTVLADKGSLADKVIIGSGDTLVSGVMSSALTMVAGDPDLNDKQIALMNGNQAKPIKANDIGGGLGAMLAIRDDVIDKSLDEMGRMAIGFAKQVNDLQQSGVDLNGEKGQALFHDVNSPALVKERALKPLGSQSDISVMIDDVNQLKTGDYQLKSDKDGHRLIDADGNVTQLVKNKDGILAANVDGLIVTLENPPTLEANDAEVSIIQPMRRGAANIGVAMNDAKGLAGHRQLLVEPAQTNTGNANITLSDSPALESVAGTYKVDISPDGKTLNVIDLATHQPVALTDATYSDENGSTIAFKRNETDAITVFALGAGAKANDSFTLTLGADKAVGGNSNFLAMQQIQHNKTMNEGKSSVIDLFEGLSTDIGMLKNNADKSAEVNQLDFDAASERVSNLSGVNLDEEAANLMKFQQSYMASSRIMSVARETFDTLMRAV